MEHASFMFDVAIEMVIFQSYFNIPEGDHQPIWIFEWMIAQLKKLR